MRKKDLVKMPPTHPPVSDRASLRQTRTKRYGSWMGAGMEYAAVAEYRTLPDREILEVDLWDGDVLAVRYFADRTAGSHMALITATGVWTKRNMTNTAFLAMGIRDISNGYYAVKEGWDYDTEEDRRKVQQYFKPDMPEDAWHTELEYWETDLQSQRRYKALDNKRARIMSMMESITPDIPDDFMPWIEQTVITRQYSLQEKLEGCVICTCTACQSSWVRTRGMGQGAVCPTCGTPLTPHYGKAIRPKHREGAKRVYLLQPCKDRRNWMERIFLAQAEYDTVNGRQIFLTETIRIVIKPGENLGCCWYCDAVNDEGSLWWDSNPAGFHPGIGYVYPGSLPEVRKFWNDGQRHSGIEVLAEKGMKFNVNGMIINATSKPAWEYLIKTGLTRLAIEDINAARTFFGSSNIVNHNGTSPEEVLRIPKDKINRLRQINGGELALGWLRYEKIMGIRVTAETLERFEKWHLKEEHTHAILEHIKNPNRLANYLERQRRTTGKSIDFLVTEYADYLDMARKQGLNLGSDIFLRPKNLIHAHDDCVLFEKSHEIELKADGIRKKFPEVEGILQEIAPKYAEEGEEFCIVVPQKIEDIVREGRALGHCIDTTDRYFERIAQRVSFLVFLRHAADPRHSWYTLEIEPGGTVRQQRTTGNNQIKADAERYMPFIREWQKHVQERMTAEDKALAAASRSTRLTEYAELREKKERVWHGRLAGKLLVDVLEGDLVEAG